MQEIKRVTIADLKFDRKNANQGKEYGTHLLRKSISELGIGRGVAVATDGTIIAGNQTVSMMAELGIEDVIIVPTDGKTLVVTQRTDIEPDSKAFHELALADNKVGLENLDLDHSIVQQLTDEFDINAHDWGFNLDEFSEEEETESQRTAKDNDNITFKLSSSQQLDLTKALATAKLEKELPDGKDTDGDALMVIVSEYLGKRS
jgi:hypothetical protein